MRLWQAAFVALALCAFLPASAGGSAATARNGVLVWTEATQPEQGPKGDELFAAGPLPDAGVSQHGTGIVAALWSPDGNSLLVNLPDGSLWVYPVGGVARRISPVAVAAAWSPDGTRIAYIGGNAELEVARADGTGTPTTIAQPTQLPGALEPVLAWGRTPQGEKIAFANAKGYAQHGIYTIGPDGRDLSFATPLVFDVTSLDWNPTGNGMLLFDDATSCRGNGQSDLFIWDGTNRRPLLGKAPRCPNLAYGAQFAVWSPDGSEIAYTDELLQPGSDARGIFTMSAGGGDTRFVGIAPPEAPLHLSWQPCGATTKVCSAAALPSLDNVFAPGGTVNLPPERGPGELAFVAQRPTGRNSCASGHCYTVIATVRADGSGLRFLTERSRDTGPEWSPDGKRIAFVRVHLMVMNADGSHLHALHIVYGSGDTDAEYVWIDRDEIAVLTDKLLGRYFTGRHLVRLVAVNVDTGRQRVLATLPWRPDEWTMHGNTIVVLSHYGLSEFKGKRPQGVFAPKPGFWTLHTDGSGLRYLGFGPPPPNAGPPNGVPPSPNVNPPFVWSPDGSRLFFVSGPGTDDERAAEVGETVWSLDVRSGDVAEVPGAPWGGEPADDLYESVSPDGSTLVLGGLNGSRLDRERVTGPPPPAPEGGFVFIPAGGGSSGRWLGLQLGWCTPTDFGDVLRACGESQPAWRPGS
jgi:Tol biopolymer transport system component